MKGLPTQAAANNSSIGTPSRILIVEGDAAAAHLLVDALSQAGYEPVWCADQAGALAWLSGNAPEVVLFNLTPHDASCLDILDSICKASRNRPPVLVMSPTDALDMRVLALKQGADDYLIKPFSAAELLARLATALRRRAAEPARYLRLGGLLVDLETARCGDGLNWTWLTPTEWRLLAELLNFGDRMVPKRQLKQVLAGQDVVTDNALEAMVSRLRAKISGWGVFIRAQRGVGYMLESNGAPVGAAAMP
ncbi:MAG: response regulator transcription factor [Sulfuritalea sp.]|jgi:DNA-binding response OmpR family regulator|nr:response regulator transcription factor [Sulfuritalea sp.]